METTASPLNKAGILDHGITSTQFHAEIPIGEHVTISDEHLREMMGVADRDLLGLKSFDFVTAVNPTDGPVGIVVKHGDGQRIQSANRTVSLQHGDPNIEKVHTVVHSESKNMPFVPSSVSLENGTETRSSLVRTATARAARWSGADANNIAHDVETHTLNGKTRHLVDNEVTADSSPVATLFHRNKTNTSFLENKYSESNRTLVGNKFVVSDKDMTQAQESLKQNLTPTSQGGLRIKAIPLHGNLEEGNITVAFNVCRQPLTAECYENEDASTGMMTVERGLKAMGEEVTAAELHLSEDFEKSAVFDAQLDD